MIIRVAAGITAGIIIKLICCSSAETLLKRRGRSYKESKAESIVLFVLSAAVGGAITYLIDLSPETVYTFLLLAVGETIAITDIHERIIPNELNLAIIIITLVFGLPSLLGVKGFPEFNALYSLLGMVVCFGIFLLPAAFSKKVGAGDIKLAAAMGFCLGLKGSLLGIVLMGLLVLVYTFIQSKLPTLSMLRSMIPMGPFLSGSMVVILLAGKLPAFSSYLAAMPF